MSLVLSGIVENESSSGPLTFCKNCIPGKNLVLKLLCPKMALGQWDFIIL